MEITADQIYQKIQERASRDPLVAEIVRNCALEAALEVQQQQFETDLLSEDEQTEDGVPEQPDEG